MSADNLNIDGIAYHPGLLDAAAQAAMVEDIRDIARAAPLFAPLTPWGKPMRVKMTAAGRFGWYTDRKGYRYIDRHPEGTPWPPIPDSVMGVWRAVSGSAREPECCLVNYYPKDARMGLHQDRDEADFDEPVVSISLGDTALFRIGGTGRGGPTQSVDLASGDVLVMGGPARLRYHGVDRIRFGTSALLEQGGRINLTLRVVT